MEKPVVVTSREGENLEIKISAVPGWEGFDKLILFLRKHYDAEVIQESDGPDARRWILNCYGQTIEVIHDDMYGNYLLAPTPVSDDIVKEIAADLEDRLKKI